MRQVSCHVQWGQTVILKVCMDCQTKWALFTHYQYERSQLALISRDQLALNLKVTACNVICHHKWDQLSVYLYGLVCCQFKRDRHHILEGTILNGTISC